MSTLIPAWLCIPFAGLLLSIAVVPLVAGEWWEKHRVHAVIFTLSDFFYGLYRALHCLKRREYRRSNGDG